MVGPDGGAAGSSHRPIAEVDVQTNCSPSRDSGTRLLDWAISGESSHPAGPRSAGCHRRE